MCKLELPDDFSAGGSERFSKLQSRNARSRVVTRARRRRSKLEWNSDMYKTFLAILVATVLSTVAAAAVPAVDAEPLDAATLDTIRSQFGRLMDLANKHDFKALHGMFWAIALDPAGGEERDPVRGELGRLLGQRGRRQKAA
jgi:hypothetical protein